MARTTKASKTTESTSSVPVPASAPEPVSESVVATSAPDPAPAPASKAKKVKKTKADEPVALATPAVEPTVVVAPATASSDEAVVVSGDVDVPVAEQSIEYLAKLQQVFHKIFECTLIAILIIQLLIRLLSMTET